MIASAKSIHKEYFKMIENVEDIRYDASLSLSFSYSFFNYSLY